MGNINTSGCYYIQEVPFACLNSATGQIALTNIFTINGLPPGSGGDGGGLPQTPWYSDINASGFALNNVSLINGSPTYFVPNPAGYPAGDVLTTDGAGNWFWAAPPTFSQTPWLSNINAANFSLSNLANLNGLPVSYYLQSPWVQPVNANSNALYNASVLQFSGTGGQIYVNATNNTMLLWGSNAGEVARAPFGISSSTSFLPQYPLDVVGSANISGCYYIQGIALACYNSGAAGFDLTNINTINGLPPGSGGGQNQTPWQSNIDANGYNLYNLNCVILGSGAPGPFYICIDINGSAQYSNKNQSGVIWMTQSGFLGIGIQQPLYSLDVYSPQDYSARIRSHTSFCGLIIDHDLTSGGESVVSFRSANNEAAIIQYDSDEDALVFWTGARDAANSTLCCDTNSRVGILTTSPAYELDVNGDCNISGTYRVNGVPISSGGGFWQGGSGGAIYYNGGDVGIGTASPQGALSVVTSSVTDTFRGISSSQYNNGPHSACLWLVKGRGSLASPSPVQVGDFIGHVLWEAVSSDGTMANSASIFVVAESVGAGAVGADLAFSVAAPGQVNPVERMRITSAGNVGIGTTTPIDPLVVNGAIRVLGPALSTNAANSFVIDENAGNARLLSWGPNTTTLGGFQFISLHSDGSGTAVPMVITPSGNVGIGVTNPRTHLTVIPSANPTSWQDYQLCIGEQSNNTAYGLYLGYSSQGLQNGFIQSVTNSQASSLFLNPYGGEIGINTTSASSALAVQGWGLSGQGQLRLANASYGVIFRNDDANFYILLTDSGQPFGDFNSLRPFNIQLSTGVTTLSELIVGVGTGAGAGDIAIGRPGTPNSGTIYFGNAGAYIWYTGSSWSFNPPLPASGGIAGISGYWSNGGGGTGPYGGAGYSGVQLNAGSNMSVACAAGSNPGVQTVIFTVGYISDMRLKDYAEPLQGGIDVVLQIHPIYAQWNGLMGKPKGKAIATVSAQDLQVVMPYAVDPIDVQLDPEVDVTTEILSYDPVAITLQCVLAIQQLVERMDALESRFESGKPLPS